MWCQWLASWASELGMSSSILIPDFEKCSGHWSYVLITGKNPSQAYFCFQHPCPLYFQYEGTFNTFFKVKTISSIRPLRKGLLLSQQCPLVWKMLFTELYLHTMSQNSAYPWLFSYFLYQSITFDSNVIANTIT